MAILLERMGRLLPVLPALALGLGVPVAPAAAQIPDVSAVCSERPAATGAVSVPTTREEARTGEGPRLGGGDPEGPASDLYCVDLFPTSLAAEARGVAELGRAPSPFAVTVTPEGHHVHDVTVWVEGLPEPASLGPYKTYVAWATPLTLHPVVRLGEVENGENRLDRVSMNKFMLLVSAEASGKVEEREGPLVLRGRSPSSRMVAHDLLAQAPSASQRPRDARPDRGGAGRDAGWGMPPSYAGVPMLPGLLGLEPRVAPFLPAASPAELPEAAPSRVVELPDGGTLDLEAGLVRRRVGDREMVMMAFNGQHPGPLIRVREKSTIFVNFTNRTPLPTSVHWHGVRLDNRFDGVPGVTQEPVDPGRTFRYRVFFRDAGLYWYHPHHREDVQQELGLYGNMRVDSRRPDYYGPANREEVLMLDDLLLDADGAVPFGDESANYTLMGRFGNVFLVNGEPAYGLEVERGEVVRFFLTNVSNTRTFNLSLVPAAPLRPTRAGLPSPGLPPSVELPRLPIKVVGSDVGRFERQQKVESVVLAPAERYVVEARFPEAGDFALVNHVQGVNHRQGVFRPELAVLGRVEVADRPARPDHSAAFETLREHPRVIAEIDGYRDRFDDPPDHELVLSLQVSDLPAPIEQSMRYDRVYFNPVEWTGTMAMMNWATTGREVRWILRDPATGRENMEIDWAFQVGDVVRLRLHNDRNAFHAMQHPLHIHGQRFLVLSQNGVPNDNLAWKDTVLLPTGSTTEILLELSNPGRWMVHCHISEHLESGMKFVMEVDGVEG